MSTYDIDQLLKLWEFEKITSEQVIGQMLVHLRTLSGKIDKLERKEVKSQAEGLAQGEVAKDSSHARR